MVANLRSEKGLDVFIHAAAVLARSHPDVTFQVAGDGDTQPVRQWIADCGIQDRFELKGSVTDIAAFLSTVDIAVLTSRSEGLSNAVLEYMAAGRPSVVTAVGANAELLEHGRHGLLVPPNDAEAVARAIGRLLDDPPLAARFGASARQRALREFSREAMIRRYERFYLNLGRGRRHVG
jgi:glycosyltransferase involved in cell wall biosynthesis